MVFAISTNTGNLLDKIKNKAGGVAYGSFIYNWSLGGNMPDNFSPVISEPWQGSEERAISMLESFPDTHICGKTSENRAWEEYVHSFMWLKDLKALGTDEARSYARHVLTEWIDNNNKWNDFSWEPMLTARRICSWVSAYDFFGSSASDHFQAEFTDSLVRQVRHLSRVYEGVIKSRNLHDIEILLIIKALIYSGVSLSGFNSLVNAGVKALKSESELQILLDGGHRTRNPENIYRALMIYVDIRTALISGKYIPSGFLNDTIDKMTGALRFLRGADKHISLFNGASEIDPSAMEKLILLVRAKGKYVSSLDKSGYNKISIGKSVLTVDCGNAPERGFDLEAHAAPTSFEFSNCKDRIFVNCGTHKSDRDWQYALRCSAAHNCLSIDNRNAMEICSDGHIGRKPSYILCDRQKEHGKCLLDISHDGYVTLNGIIHRRRLYMDNQGDRLMGEEILSRTNGRDVSSGKPYLNDQMQEVFSEFNYGESEFEESRESLAVRFHLHPKSVVSLINEGTEALVRVASGKGWRFSCANGKLALEDSVYVGNGVYPQKTTQIVIYENMGKDYCRIKWKVQKEG